jgi:hypothetical protein
VLIGVLSICKKWLKMTYFAGITINEHPLWKNVRMWTALPQLHAEGAEIIEKWVKLYKWHFSNELRLAQWWTCGSFIYNEVESLFLEYLYHFGSKVCLIHILQIAISEKLIPR